MKQSNLSSCIAFPVSFDQQTVNQSDPGGLNPSLCCPEEGCLLVKSIFFLVETIKNSVDGQNPAPVRKVKHVKTR